MPRRKREPVPIAPSRAGRPDAPPQRPITSSSASEHYRREKAKRARTAPPHADLLAAARREYEALLAADAAKGKGGRPKKVAVKPKPADEDDVTD